jgi:hypothetical protein
MDFFPPDPPDPTDDEEQEHRQPVWMGPPDDVLPGVVPVEVVLGRSDSTVVALTGMRAFPTGVQMNLAVRVRGPVARRDLHSEVFDGPYNHGMDAQWQAGRLKWGFELADGRRVTNVDPWPQPPDHDHSHPHDADDWLRWEPDHPVLQGGGGGGGNRSVDRDYWLWPLPPAGRLRVVCQWPDQDIELTVQDLDAEPLLAAAHRASPLWPRRPDLFDERHPGQRPPRAEPPGLRAQEPPGVTGARATWGHGQEPPGREARATAGKGRPALRCPARAA